MGYVAVAYLFLYCYSTSLFVLLIVYNIQEFKFSNLDIFHDIVLANQLGPHVIIILAQSNKVFSKYFAIIHYVIMRTCSKLSRSDMLNINYN